MILNLPKFIHIVFLGATFSKIAADDLQNQNTMSFQYFWLAANYKIVENEYRYYKFNQIKYS